jgi:hypothetical protein
MRANRFLPVLALFLFLPAGADEAGAKAPPRGDEKTAEKPRCCAGEEGGDKALCAKTKAKTAAVSKKHAERKASPATADSAAAAAPRAPGAGNMVVTRDPETGELRNATPEEREKLLGRRALAAPAAPRVVILPDGTEMVELGDENMSYAVARRNPDGTVTQTCVEGHDAASTARKPKAVTPAPRTEER